MSARSDPEPIGSGFRRVPLLRYAETRRPLSRARDDDGIANLTEIDGRGFPPA